MPVSIALVGLGDIGVRAHLPALLARGDVVLAAIADIDSARVDAESGNSPADQRFFGKSWLVRIRLDESRVTAT